MTPLKNIENKSKPESKSGQSGGRKTKKRLKTKRRMTKHRTSR